ncbi:MAG: CDP-alcohol phosphatidyltransferase family protein [Elusimicrobiota bacterium]|nr:CDP-alcohol phosphatidyltransferase family protein [Elusimicrobiota bacterium]
MKNLTLPNKLTISRIIAVPIFVISTLAKNSGLAVSVFIFCVITDFLDGLIARKRGERTPLGAFLDPLADKFLLISAFITFAALKEIPVWIPIVVITKNIIIFLGWWLRLQLTGNSVVSPTLFGKLSTILEMTVILFILTGIPEKILFILTYLMLFSIIVSTFNYIFWGIKEMEK